MSVASRRIRDSYAPSSSSVAAASANSTTFIPQPLSLPLSDTAQAALTDLLRTHARSTILSSHLSLAIKQITEVTGDLNESGYEKRTRYERASARRRVNGEDSDEEEHDAHVAFQEKVQSLTKKMDMGIRAVIDDQIWLEDFPTAMQNVIAASEEQSTQHQEEHNQSPTPIQSTRQTQPERDTDEDGDADGEENSEHTSLRALTQSQPKPSITPHALLQSLLQKQSRDWQSKTLTERYTPNNDYRGWKRIWYDANNPGESAPPMPDDSLWFAAEEGRNDQLFASQSRVRPGVKKSSHNNTSRTNPDDNANDSGSDLEISREKTRLKCSITLLPYRDPVTSANCEHSYERSAILDMLRHSADHVPLSSSQVAEIAQIRNRRDRDKREKELKDAQERQVKCPECNVPLLEGDLRPNPALQRRVQKLLAAEAKKRDRDEAMTSDVDDEDRDEMDEDGVVSGTQRRPVGLGSSPPPSSSRRSLKSIKPEQRESFVPQTQGPMVGRNVGTPRATGMASSGRVMIVDMDEQDDDDDDDDE